jgi:hypothetical protein
MILTSRLNSFILLFSSDGVANDMITGIPDKCKHRQQAGNIFNIGGGLTFEEPFFLWYSYADG